MRAGGSIPPTRSALLWELKQSFSKKMKLYATVTSERASKGQGGNEYVNIDLMRGSAKDSKQCYKIHFTSKSIAIGIYIYLYRDRTKNNKMEESQSKIHDALDAIINNIFVEKVFDTTEELNQEKLNELRFYILGKLNEMGVKLVEMVEPLENYMEGDDN